jgi:uncharacterized transporter YbjL
MNRAEIKAWTEDIADILGVRLLMIIFVGGITWATWMSHEMTAIKVDVAEIKGHLHGAVTEHADDGNAHTQLASHKAKETEQ